MTARARFAGRLLFCLLAFLQIAVLHAQQGKTPVPKDFPGRWFRSDDCPACEDRYHFTLAESAEFHRQLERVVQGIRENQVFGALQGIDVEVNTAPIAIPGAEFDPAIAKGRPRARAEIKCFPLQHTFDKQKRIWFVEAGCSPVLTVVFNHPDVLWTSGVSDRENEPGKVLSGFFIALEEVSHPTQGITLCRLPSEQGHMLIVAAGTRPVFAPVTRGDVLAATRKYYEYKRRRVEEQGNSGAMGDYDLKLASLKKVEDQLKYSLDEPAFVRNVSQFSEGSYAYLCPEGTKGSKAVVGINSAYFDDSLPRTAIQLVCMHFYYGSGDQEKNIRTFLNARRLKEALRAFDAQSLKALLDVN